MTRISLILETVGSASTITVVKEPSDQIVVASLYNRLADLQSIILEPPESVSKVEIEKISSDLASTTKTLVTKVKSNGLSYDEAVSIASDLDAIALETKKVLNPTENLVIFSPMTADKKISIYKRQITTPDGITSTTTTKTTTTQ